MDDCCKPPNSAPPADARYRRVLWIALIVNAAMFCIEILAGWRADSVSLLADAVDFFGDAINYGVSIFVLGFGALWRSRVALCKGIVMGLYGMALLVAATAHALRGDLPDAHTMGGVGLLALAANLSVGALLYAYRHGQSDMRAVWLCTRNDVIGNLAVLLAALGVFGTGTGWPDIIVATIMAMLALLASPSIIAQARREIAHPEIADGVPDSHRHH
jgi:Co/Zn/Cd efflux system component